MFVNAPYFYLISLLFLSVVDLFPLVLSIFMFTFVSNCLLFKSLLLTAFFSVPFLTVTYLFSLFLIIPLFRLCS
jgi:hypothetical protein